MKQMKHMKRTELADQRTGNRKVFENQDHSRTVKIIWSPYTIRTEVETGRKWMIPFRKQKRRRIYRDSVKKKFFREWIWKAQCRKIKSRDF